MSDKPESHIAKTNEAVRNRFSHHPAPLDQRSPVAERPETATKHLPSLSLVDSSLTIKSGEGPYQALRRAYPDRRPEDLSLTAHKIKRELGHGRLHSGDQLTRSPDGSVTHHREKGPNFVDTTFKGGKPEKIKSHTAHEGGGFTELTENKNKGRKIVHERNRDGSFREEERDKHGNLKRTLIHEKPAGSPDKAKTTHPAAAPSLNEIQPNIAKIAKATVAHESDPDRSDLSGWHKAVDYLQNSSIRAFGDVPRNPSIGPAQMRADHIRRLVSDPKNPELDHLNNPHYLRLALEPKNASLLVAAYYREKADRLNCGLPGSPDASPKIREQVNNKIRELWASPKREDREAALIRTYNPGDGNSYVQRVRKHESVQ